MLPALSCRIHLKESEVASLPGARPAHLPGRQRQVRALPCSGTIDGSSSDTGGAGGGGGGGGGCSPGGGSSGGVVVSPRESQSTSGCVSACEKTVSSSMRPGHE